MIWPTWPNLAYIWPNLAFRGLGLALHGLLLTNLFRPTLGWGQKKFQNFTGILAGFSQSWCVKSFLELAGLVRQLKIDHYKSKIVTKLLKALKNLICKLHRVAHYKNIKFE